MHSTRSPPITNNGGPGWVNASDGNESNPGTVRQFDEAAFRAHYAANSGAAFDALAKLYQQPSAAALLAAHPELVDIALNTGRSLIDGPALAGRATLPARYLESIDAQLNSADLQALMARHGGPPPVATSSFALNQVNLYGQHRFEQMERLSHALAALRNDYSQQLTAAITTPGGVGWSDVQVEVVTRDESVPFGAALTTTVQQFSIDAFTRWYSAQPNAEGRVFAHYYGQSTTLTSVLDESNQTSQSTSFGDGTWSLVGTELGHRDLATLDINNVPDLRNNRAITFEAGVGWATEHQNIDRGIDWFDVVLTVVVGAVLTYITAGIASELVGMWIAEVGAGAIAAGEIAGIADVALTVIDIAEIAETIEVIEVVSSVAEAGSAIVEVAEVVEIVEVAELVEAVEVASEAVELAEAYEAVDLVDAVDLTELAELADVNQVQVVDAANSAADAADLGSTSSTVTSPATPAQLNPFVQGGIRGFSSSLVNGVLNDDFSIKGLLIGTLAGSLSSGLIDVLNSTAAIQSLGSAGQVLSNAIVQGSISELRGGDFTDGAVSGLASGLAAVVSGNMNEDIDRALSRNLITPSDAIIARGFTTFVTSAIRVAGTPGDLGQALARDFLGSLVNQQMNGPTPSQSQALRDYEGIAQSDDILARRAGEIASAQSTEAETSEPHEASTTSVARTADDAARSEIELPSSDVATADAPDATSALSSEALRTAFRQSETEYANSEASAELPLAPVPPPDSAELDKLIAALNRGYPHVILSDGSVVELKGLSSNERNGLIERQQAGSQLTELEAAQLNANNDVLQRTLESNGAKEGSGYVRDEFGNIRSFSLNRNNEIARGLGEEVVERHYYRDADRRIVLLEPGQALPEGVSALDSGIARELRYDGQLIGTDYGVPKAWADRIAVAGNAGGDPVAGLRMQVAIDRERFPTLAAFVDPGTGQVNPLRWQEFQAEAMDLARASKTPLPMVVTSNGMRNGYQAANNNANLIAQGYGNAIVINVLNPTTETKLGDGLEAFGTQVGMRQTVPIALNQQLQDAREFNDAMSQRIFQGTPIKTNVILHSQATINGTVAFEEMKDDAKRDYQVFYLGTAAQNVPSGLGGMGLIYDRNDPVTNSNLIRGDLAIERTFKPPPSAGELPQATQDITRPVPTSYVTLQTNFDRNGNSVGNYHSLYLYIGDPSVRAALGMLNAPPFVIPFTDYGPQ
jgi:hypothetical protein